MTILDRIFKELEKQNIKPIRLCEHIGISTGLLSTWKKRGTDPKAMYIKPISEFLGVSESYLLTGEENQDDFSELEGVYLSLAKEAQNNAIDPEDIRMAIKMIKDIRESENKK